MATLVLGPDRAGLVVQVEAGRVARLAEGSAAFASGERLDASTGLIQPGRVNAHTHIYSGLAPLGMPAPKQKPENFVQILERIWWRLDRALDASALRAAARLYVAESLLAGTTTLIDHHESPSFIEGSLDVLREACEELGIRALLCYGATERNEGRREARRGLEECRRFARGAGGRALAAVGLHASFTVSDETIREAAELARELGVPLHVHVAEALSDVEDAKRRGFAGVVARFHDLGALVQGSIFAHGVHLREEEVRLATERGCWLVQNARSNENNRVGYPSALGASDRVAVGTDGFPARMDEEAAFLAERARARSEPAELVSRRLAGGHRMLAELWGLPFAPIETGTAADLCVLDGDRARHVIVDGRVVVRDGALVAADIEEIRASASVEAKKLWTRMEML